VACQSRRRRRRRERSPVATFVDIVKQDPQATEVPAPVRTTAQRRVVSSDTNTPLSPARGHVHVETSSRGVCGRYPFRDGRPSLRKPTKPHHTAPRSETVANHALHHRGRGCGRGRAPLPHGVVDAYTPGSPQGGHSDTDRQAQGARAATDLGLFQRARQLREPFLPRARPGLLPSALAPARTGAGPVRARVCARARG